MRQRQSSYLAVRSQRWILPVSYQQYQQYFGAEYQFLYPFQRQQRLPPSRQVQRQDQHELEPRMPSRPSGQELGGGDEKGKF